MAIFRIQKEVTSLPSTLQPSTIYLIKNARGFDFYVTDENATPTAFKLNETTFVESRWASTDCNNNNAVITPFIAAGISSGSYNAASEINSSLTYGVMKLRSSTTNNSGAYVMANQPLQGVAGLTFRGIIAPINSATNRTARFGFLDTLNSNQPVDGAYFEMSNLTVRAVTASNSIRTFSASTYTLSADTFYIFDVEYLSTSEVEYTIYDLATGNEVFTTTITTNIPTGSSRTFYSGAIATNNSSSATSLIEIDYMGFGPVRPPFMRNPFPV